MFDSLVLLPRDEGWVRESRPTKRELNSSEWMDEPPLLCTAGDELVELAADLPFGAHTMALLLETRLDDLSDAGRSLLLQTVARFVNYVEGYQAKVIAAVAGPEPATARERRNDFSPTEVAVATKCSVYAADDKITFARDLTSRLQKTLRAMESGVLTLAQARWLSEKTCHLPVSIARQIEERALRFAHRQDLTLFKGTVRRALTALDPDWEARAKRVRHEVSVDHHALDDGTGMLTIRGPLETTTQISMWLSAKAAQTKDELGGTSDQRKLAALFDAALTGLDDRRLPRKHGRHVVLNITIDLPTLLGLRNNPAEIPGIGAIPADVARQLTADGAVLRRLIIDPRDGHLLDYGTTTYLVPPPLSDFLIAQGITSAAPHSHVNAADTDMEHDIPHDRAGPTDPVNNTPIDRRWHRAKTHAGTTYRKDPKTAVVTWQLPSGLTCQVDPYDYRTGP
jgi:Domain of unknown function (DUF222)